MFFSIAIPAYKAKYLREAIESCLSQSYQKYEVVIVDDASPENLSSIVSDYTDERIRYYRNEKNCGALNVVDNWNICLSHCSGKYVICMGDDDILLPNCLEEYVKIINQYPGLGVYHGWTQIIDENGNIFDMQEHRPSFESAYSLAWHRWVYRKRQYIGDFCYDVQKLRSEGGFYKLPLAWASDDISAIRAAVHNGIANTQVPVFQYRVNRYTLSKSANNKWKLDAILLEIKWYESFFKVRPQNELDLCYYNLMLADFTTHWEKKKILYIARDIQKGTMNFFWWYANRKKYGLNRKNILQSLKKALFH